MIGILMTLALLNVSSARTAALSPVPRCFTKIPAFAGKRASSASSRRCSPPWAARLVTIRDDRPMVAAFITPALITVRNMRRIIGPRERIIRAHRRMPYGPSHDVDRRRRIDDYLGA